MKCSSLSTSVWQMGHMRSSRVAEDLNKRRQPLPALEAVYFIQPKLESVQKVKMDFSDKTPLYKKAHVFFSSPVTKDLVQVIKNDASLFSRIATLKEMNLEYLTIDSQAFSTDNGRALEQLFGEHSEGSREYSACLNTIATRLGTVFASLKVRQVVELIRDQQSLVFFDLGARAKQLAEKMGIKTDEIGPAYTASMAASGHEVAVTPLIGKLRLHIHGSVGHEEFYIMPLEGCDVLLEALPGQLPPERSEDHNIDLIPGSVAPNKPPYRVSAAQQEEIMTQVIELLQKGR
ncbi:hypothetical protein L7F22_041748 [Adiantum nelumboides]|nr:hypothetical protein [Adiantum nelumboides]